MIENRRNFILEIFFLALMPIILLSFNSNWIYNPPGFIDHWLYWGFFQNPKLYIGDWFRETYYGSRLTVILPGACIYAFFKPFVANIILHLLYFLSTSFAIYFIVLKLFGSAVAFRTCLILMLNPYFLISIGTDYVDGPGIAYFSIALAFIVNAALGEKPSKSLMLSGIFSACAIVSNVTWLIFISFLPLIFLFVQPVHMRLSIWRCAGSVLAQFILGITTLMILLGLINMHLGGHFFFLAPSFRFVRSSLLQTNIWHKPFSIWIEYATWLSIPVLAMFVAMLQFRKLGNTQIKDGRNIACLRVISIAFGICFFVYFALDFIGVPFIQLWYYASYLIPFQYVVLGPFLFHQCRFDSNGDLFKKIKFTSMVVIIGLVPLAPVEWCRNIDYLPNLILGRGVWILILMSLGFVTLGCYLPERVMRTPLVILGWGLCNCSTIFISGDEVRLQSGILLFPSNQPVQCFGFGNAFCASSCYQKEKGESKTADSFVRICESYEFINQDRGKPLIWYSSRDRNFLEFRSIASCYLFMYSLINEDYPVIEKRELVRLVKQEKMIFLSTNQITENCLNEVLNVYGYSVHKLSEREISNTNVCYWIFIGRLERISKMSQKDNEASQ